MDNTLLYNKLSQLQDDLKFEVANFIDFLISKNKKSSKNKPMFGSAKGMFSMKNDFDNPIDDFKDYQ